MKALDFSSPEAFCDTKSVIKAFEANGRLYDASQMPVDWGETQWLFYTPLVWGKTVSFGEI